MTIRVAPFAADVRGSARPSVLPSTQPVVSKQGGPAPTLVLTGHRNQGHHLVKLEGTPIWLSGSLFDLICEMALARGRSQLGFVSCNRMAIQRLRCVLDSATGQQGLGARMIVTGSKSHYRLALDPGYISLDSTFDELPDNLLTPELVKGLRIRFDGG